MIIKPNNTLVEGTVRKVTRCADGWGADIEFEVSRNLAGDPSRDFVRAKAGEILKVFAARPENLEEGASFQLETSRLAGPHGSRGGRVVVQAVKKLSA